jgi:hypothetical protein
MNDVKKTEQKSVASKSGKLIKGSKKETAPAPCKPMYGG